MALSKVIKVSDGVTRQFAVSFELGYIREADITAWVEGEVDGTGAPIYRAITFLTPEMLEIAGTIPAAGVQIIFERTVPRDRLLVDYEDGDIINDDNLNTSQKQALMLIHELLDGRFETFDSNIDYGGFRIINLGDPVDPTDGANKRYVDDKIAMNQASEAAAAASALAAAGSASAAAGSASDSATSANLSMQWAISGTIVQGIDYSSKYYAAQAAAYAASIMPGQFLKIDGTNQMTGRITVSMPADGDTAAFLRGQTHGLRIVPAAGSVAVEAVDYTGTTSYSPLRLQGSTVTITGPMTVPNAAVFNGGITIRQGGAELQWWDNSAALNMKRARVVVSAGGTYLQALNDDGSHRYTAFGFSHSSGVVGFNQRPLFGIATPWDSVNLPTPINDAPSDNSTYARKNAAWVKSVGGAIMSDTAPVSPENGQKWINTTTMREYTWYVDANSSQWVETTNSDAQRPASDGKPYIMKNGVWTRAPIEFVAVGTLNGAFSEVDLPADIDVFDFEFDQIRPTTGSANYVVMQFHDGTAWRNTVGTYGWGDHYFNAGNHSTWTESTSGAFSDAIAVSSGAVTAADSNSYGHGKLWAGQASVRIPQATYESRVGITHTTGSGWLGANIRISKVRVGITGATALASVARFTVRGLKNV